MPDLLDFLPDELAEYDVEDLVRWLRDPRDAPNDRVRMLLRTDARLRRQLLALLQGEHTA